MKYQPTSNRRLWPKMRASLLVLLTIGGMLTACTSKTKTAETLVFADPSHPMAGLVYIADTLGYFRDENLTLTYRKFSSGRDAINSVLAGQADVGVATEFPLAKNILEDKDLQIIGSLYRTSEYAALVGRRDRGIHQIADLQGKRIGIAPNTNSDYMLSQMLAETGLADAAVTRVALKPEQMADALAAGSVDAVATWPPHVSQSEARFAPEATVRLISASHTELSLLGAQAHVLAQKTEAFHRLLRVMVRAEDYVVNHNAEALQLLSRHLGARQEADLRRAWPAMKFQVRLDHLMLAALTDEAGWLAARATPKPATPDFRRHINPQFLEAARPQAVTLTFDKVN